MVMMAGEVFVELVPRELVARQHAMHNPRLFEHDEIAVRRTLRQAVARGEQLGNGERAGRGGEDVDDLAPRGSEPLRLRTQTMRHFIVQGCGPGHAAKCTG